MIIAVVLYHGLSEFGVLNFEPNMLSKFMGCL